MRKIYESQVIDETTGELLSTKVVTSTKDVERFMFARTTEGLEWLTEFNSLRDLQVFMYMVEFQEPKSKIIIFSSLQIQECAKFLNCTEKTIRNSISSLIGTKFLKRLAMHNYISNPLTFYKGGTLGLHTSIQLWEKY